ncbi:hypothetical protein MK079_03120 [Candidatus Gracilibacteria bacterium]|nr:hypothetical protein [Candidatus Gracilibacteria bacterium]
MKNVQLVIIDPQNDFMDTTTAALPVPGATDDMARLSSFINRVGNKLDGISVTLDSHATLDYRHPGAWKNQNGENPVPITAGGAPITADDIRSGIWEPIYGNQPQAILGGQTIRDFMIECAENRNNQTGGAVPGLEIWPEHCIIGTEGHNVFPELMDALQQWERDNKKYINYCTKGTNPLTEHYGALEANDPIAADPSTSLNTNFLQTLQNGDFIVIAGEAASHCVMSTVNQIVDNIGENGVKKLVLLTDCMSPVAAITDEQGNMIVDFPGMTDAWYAELEAKGVVLTTSVEFLA